MKNILVLGAAGQIGSELVHICVSSMVQMQLLLPIVAHL